MSSGQTFTIPVLCLVLITLLNDGCILSIAYDKVLPSARPTEWKLGELIGIAIVVGSIACVAILSLLILGLHALNNDNDVYHNFWVSVVGLSQPMNYMQLQTLMYLAVSLSGFLIIFAARTRGFFFTRRPGTPLGVATVFALAASTVINLH